MEKPLNNSSLKGKVLNLESLIRQISENLTRHVQEVSSMQAEHDEGASFNVLQLKAKRIRTNLQMELERLESHIKAHFAQQKVQRVRLTQQITSLKNEKNLLQKTLAGLQRRLSEIQLKLGVDL